MQFVRQVYCSLRKDKVTASVSESEFVFRFRSRTSKVFDSNSKRLKIFISGSGHDFLKLALCKAVFFSKV